MVPRTIFETRATSPPGGSASAPARADEAVALLAKLRRGEWLVEFLRNGGGHGTAADRDTAGENFTRLDEEKVGRARADIDQQRTSAQVAVVIAKRVVERHGREIDNRGAQTRFLDRGD